MFFGGVYNMLPHLMGALDHVEEAFRNGGGVHQSQYDERNTALRHRDQSSWRMPSSPGM